MLLSFVTVVVGSQQMLLLPTERPHESDEDLENSTTLDSKDTYDKEMRENEKLYLQAVVKRLCDTRQDDRPNRTSRPNTFLVFALQAPIMLLTLSVLSFLVGLCSVVFAPLANHLAWDDNAKVSSDIQLFNDDTLNRGCRLRSNLA